MSTTGKKAVSLAGNSLLGFVGWGIPLLVAIAGGTYLAQTRQTDDIKLKARARDEIRAMTSALLLERPGRRAMPSTAEGLHALVSDSTLPGIPDDPWGQPYQYRNPGTIWAWELYSLGPDGVESQDDIVSWNLYGGR